MHRLKPAHQDDFAPEVSIDGILNHRRDPRLLGSLQYPNWSNQDLIIKDKPPSMVALRPSAVSDLFGLLPRLCNDTLG